MENVPLGRKFFASPIFKGLSPRASLLPGPVFSLPKGKFKGTTESEVNYYYLECSQFTGYSLEEENVRRE
jgi:hypothetical protein